MRSATSESTRNETARSTRHLKYKKNDSQNGFSLIELVISAGIMAALSAIVIVRFSAFDSTVILKSLAYEVAASVRDAQVYSISVARGSLSFDERYGMHFVPDSKSYIFFRYSGNVSYPLFDQGDADYKALRIFEIGRTLRVKDVCVVVSNTEDCDVAAASVTFRRPEFRAIYSVDGAPPAYNKIVESLKVKLSSSSKPNEVWIVEISSLGQISVYKEE